MDMQKHLKNRHEFPHEELEKYAGKYVAWSPDGTHIIASADDLSQLCEAVDASPYDAAEVVMEPIPFPDEVVLGGGLDE
jgi:glucose/arabinose dehydrogenase